MAGEGSPSVADLVPPQVQSNQCGISLKGICQRLSAHISDLQGMAPKVATLSTFHGACASMQQRVALAVWPSEAP